ncbi:MAG TPA: hypothetical protein VE967_19320 [Gemmatimonadaceae bacterium]|nr:hypothetical protein [Gemmatimonadaceae bacterium]
MPAPWTAVTEREHPFGKAGVNSSLDEVAKRVSKGAIDPGVRTWAIEMLDVARERGLSSAKTPNDRARILLSAVQKKLWVPDPIGAEYMPAATLLACDPKTNPNKVCIRGDDCDGVATLLGAAWMSVGIHTLVVGHAYDDEHNIEHVLCAAHLDGRWHYGDPSTDYQLGKCVPFTYERILSVPNVKVICDDEVCIGAGGGRSFDPDRLNFVDKGVFIGVDGLRGLRARVVWKPGDRTLERALTLARCPG